MQVTIITSHKSNKYHCIRKIPPYFHSMELTEVPLAKAIAMGLDFCPTCFDKEPT